MDIDFPLILVLLTLGTGVVWAIDRLFFYQKRFVAAEQRAKSTGTDLETELEEPALVEMSRSFFPVLALVLVLRSFLVEPFQIPSGSMLPTLEVGDFILVNKFTYGVRLPVLGTKVVSLGDPKAGDVLVFRFPKDGKTNYIKRVVGVGGDVIRYDQKNLFINGQQVSSDFEGAINGQEMFEENLSGTVHNIYKDPGRGMHMGAGEWVVPEGHYFVMGDNRDNSNDSRFWGFVPDHLVVGKAFAIWMHWETLFSIPSFSRVGGFD
ncbi:MAG: signal peptidase I [Hahellaceae bacterium]|jgi:signal peptidase I|nr:signal peptidase I [Hahellaceae bacterium]MCP5212375.1 signal peptidase I [Hahellaceae bacterium]